MSVQPLVAVESPLRLVHEEEVKLQPLRIVRLEERPKPRSVFDIAVNVAAAVVIGMALLVLGMVLATVSAPDAGSVAAGLTDQVAPLADVFGGGLA